MSERTYPVGTVVSVKELAKSPLGDLEYTGDRINGIIVSMVENPVMYCVQYMDGTSELMVYEELEADAIIIS